MNEYNYVTLRQVPELKEIAAKWFHDKWKVPQEAYLECIESYLNHKTEYGWYLCLDNMHIVGGLGVIENDFHNRKDLAPNVCALYTEQEYRNQGIAGQLLDIVVKDMKLKGITPIYLITDHANFYEKYGWKCLCMVQADNDNDITRMYIHK
ncbi:GNAT family N-acetyltransferase [Levilactobacillus tujiorum]|uniref:GNAT family N-acetyltransferase n=1 Tax=Levilactobacillus tujiorum TaxID=2912243 RepID=A0ABX1L7G9_9LACO|nr:GNAT family N-acetyltransferase [Levilactobacillus tujiorum]MCH5465310.1 GNAT family N-acetyltransferase [Levilactobacillus tujiorum]NLR12302.1 GNAT family N-acetyltransferase [Lactobacillus sp. HBUAS51387]NLR30314.1 GNAT family N-acetyltransferase [Levilactobacillus tujiorum]